MNIILETLSDLRDKFLNSADNQSNMIEGILGNQSISSGAITDGLGNVVSILENDGIYSLMIKNAESVNDLTSIFSGTESELRDYLDGVIDTDGILKTDNDQSIVIKTFLQDSVSGMNLNLAISSLLDKFSVDSSIQSSNLISLLDNLNLSSTDASQLKTMISLSASGDGSVSINSFLSSLKQVCDQSKEALDDNQLTLDDSDIPYLTNFLATAIPGLVSTIGSLISAVLTVVNAAVGVIVSIITTVASNILNAVTNAMPSEVTVSNPASTTDWFEGPATSATVSYIDSPIYGNNVLKYDEVAIFHDGCYDTALFLSSDGTKVNINKFLSLNLDRDKMWNWLADLLGVSTTISSGSSGGNVTLTLKQAAYRTPRVIPTSCYLDDNGRDIFLSYSDREKSNYICSSYGAYCLAQIMAYMAINSVSSLVIQADSPVGQSVNDWCFNLLDSVDYYYPITTEANKTAKYTFLTRLLDGINIWAYVQGTGWYHNFDNDVLTTIALREHMISGNASDTVFNAVKSFSSISLNNRPLEPGHPTYGLDIQQSLTLYDYDICCGLCQSGSFIINHGPYFLSSIPKDRMFSYAGYSETKLIIFTAVTATVAAVALVVGTIAAKRIKRWKWKKQMNKKRDLMKIQKKYSDNPTDANLNALYKAQKKYNFQAKIFGWDTYDAANNWWNAPDSSASQDNLYDIRYLLTGKGK